TPAYRASGQMRFVTWTAPFLKRALKISAGGVEIETGAGRDRRCAAPQMTPQHCLEFHEGRLVPFVCHCRFYLPLVTSPSEKPVRIFVYLSLRTLNASPGPILRRHKMRSRRAFDGGAFNVYYQTAHIEFGARGDLQAFGDLGPAQPVAAL